MNLHFIDERHGEGGHHRLMKCSECMYVDVPFPLVLLVSTTKHITLIFYLPAFFHSSFFKSNLRASSFADMALILGCSLRLVLGFSPMYVMDLGTIYSCRVNFIYSAFSWPVTQISERAGTWVQYLGTTLLSQIKRIIQKDISILWSSMPLVMLVSIIFDDFEIF